MENTNEDFESQNHSQYNVENQSNNDFQIDTTLIDLIMKEQREKKSSNYQDNINEDYIYAKKNRKTKSKQSHHYKGKKADLKKSYEKAKNGIRIFLAGTALVLALGWRS